MDAAALYIFSRNVLLAKNENFFVLKKNSFALDFYDLNQKEIIDTVGCPGEIIDLQFGPDESILIFSEEAVFSLDSERVMSRLQLERGDKEDAIVFFR